MTLTIPFRRLALLPAALLALGAAAPDPTRQALPPSAPRSASSPGRVLFKDDFSDTSLAGWTMDRKDVWRVRSGMLRGDLPDRKQEHSLIAAGDESWTDYTVDVDVCAMRGADKGALVRMVGQKQAVGVDLRGPGYQDVLIHEGARPLGRARAINPNGTWHHLRIEARGRRFRVWVDDALAIDHAQARGTRGRIALAAYTGGVGECTVYFDNVVVTESR